MLYNLTSYCLNFYVQIIDKPRKGVEIILRAQTPTRFREGFNSQFTKAGSTEQHRIGSTHN